MYKTHQAYTKTVRIAALNRINDRLKNRLVDMGSHINKIKSKLT